jgi:nucleoside-diphosphate-sugar epimerase
MITIGVTAVGGGVGQSALRALDHADLKVRTVGLDVQPLSLGLYWVHAAHLLPPVSKEAEYIERLVHICRDEGLALLIPGSDTELPALAAHRPRLLAQGCEVVVASPEVVHLCRDKYALYRFCAERGLPFVTTYTLAEAQSRAGELDLPGEIQFPVIVKPRGGSASVGARLIYDADDLRRLPPGEDHIVQAYLPPSGVPARLANGRLDQRGEISVQFFVGPAGRILGTFASVNRLKDGVPVEILPDPDSPAIEAGLPLVRALVARGLVGPINLQGRLTPQGVLFFEANARFTGITRLRAMLGYREVEAAVWAFALGREDEAAACLAYTPGYVGLRYVSDAVVPAERVAQVEVAAAQGPAPAPAAGGDPRRVLVSGASGYIGANLVAHLLALPGVEEVRAAVRDRAAGARLAALFGGSERLRIVYGELPASPWPLEGVDLVIHAAALRPAADPAHLFLVNVEGTRQLLAAMRRAGVGRLIYLSSQAVYGLGRPLPWSEALPARPETPYALSKWMAELLCLDGISAPAGATVLRLSRAYGLGHHLRWQEMPHKFARLAAAGQPLPLHDGGRDRLDLVHVRDLAEAVARACHCPLPGGRPAVVNVGGGQPLSVARLAELCQAAAGDCGLARPEIEQIAAGPQPPRAFGLDIGRARTCLGWAPAVDPRAAFVELIEAARRQEGGNHGR